MGWSITPTTGVQNPDAQDGKYIFIPQLNDITYTITYTDDKGLEGTIQYTVKSTDCMVCGCNKFTLIPRVDTIPEDGYTTDTVIATINGYCVANGKTMDSYLNPVIVSGADMVKSISTAYTDDYTVSVYAKINPNPGDTRKFKIRFDIVNSYMVVKQSCDAEYEFTQAPNHCYVEEAPTVTPNVINNVPSAGGNYTVSYNTTGCWVQEYVEYDHDIIELSAGSDDFDVLENKTANPRNTTINYGFRNTVNNELAIRPVEINQLANECVNAPEPSACFDITQAECATYRTSDAAEQNIPVKFINMGDCWVYVSNRKDGKVIEVTASQTGSKFSITSNTDPSQATSHVYYTFKNTTTERTVEKPVTVIQSVNDCITAPEPTVCFDPIQQECTAYTTSSSDESLAYTVFNGLGSCWKYKSYGKTGNVKQNGVTVEGNNSVIALSANTSASAVDSNVYYTFRNDIKGIEVTKTVKITQPAGCNCSDIYFTYAGHDVNFSVNEVNTWTKVGEITVTKNGCIDSVGVTSITEGLTVQAVPNGTNKKDVEVKITRFNQYQENGQWVTARKLQFKITLNNQPCGNIYELYQQAFRGTDNGADRYANGEILSEPLFFVGTPGSSAACLQPGVKIACRDYRVGCGDECEGHDCAQYGIDRRNGGKHDADSIICEGGAYFVDDNNPSNTHKIDSTWGGVYLNENGVVSEEDAWLFVDASCDQTDTGKECSPGLCNVGMVRVTVIKNNNTGACRFARFKLASEPDPTKPAKKIASTGCSSPPEHAGEEAAREWYYDIVQIPEGYYLCNYDDKHPENYIITGLKPLTETCDDCNKEVHGQCRCAYH